MSADTAYDRVVREMFARALLDNRCTELLECVAAGGSATIDARSGELVLITAEQLASLFGAAS